VWTLRGHSVDRIPFDNATWLTMLSKLNNFYIKAERHSSNASDVSHCLSEVMYT